MFQNKILTILSSRKMWITFIAVGLHLHGSISEESLMLVLMSNMGIQSYLDTKTLKNPENPKVSGE